jgi:arylsulfatase A-like enzyme
MFQVQWLVAVRFPAACIRTFLLCVVATFFCFAQLIAAEPTQTCPNILWISCEDISPHLGCYGDTTATTPNLDRLASQGAMFTHAFSCHGVCAPSRTGIITGMYPIALGANHMRSKAGLPSSVKLFPQLLREAGYYCTNNSKTDYNLNWNQKATWDVNSAKAHWKNRPTPDTPFFAVFNLTMTHESKVWPVGWKDVVAELPEEQRHRAEDMIVPPLYPDAEAVREDFARLADLITVVDQEVGRLLKELDDAGLSDNTIVMFWSDHGNGLPRAKRWTYDSGSRVPLIVRVPQSLRAAADIAPPNSTDDRMVNLIDLGPTVLNLAGVSVPEHMHGRPFLGPQQHDGHEFIFGARDRLDERFDMVRTVRTRQYRYVRNLMPWRPALQHVAYGETNETMKEMRRLLKDGQLDPASSQWFTSPRAAEELYDLTNDPSELKNLASSPEHQQVLNTLQQTLDDWQVHTGDVHLLPETVLDEAQQLSGDRASIFQGEAGHTRAKQLLNAAKLASHLRASDAVTSVDQLSPDLGIRWWQVSLAAHALGVENRLNILQHESTHPHPAIRIAAAGGLARVGQTDEAAKVLQDLLTSDNEFIRHATILEIDEAGEPLIKVMSADLESFDAKDHEYSSRLLQHALESLQ